MAGNSSERPDLANLKEIENDFSSLDKMQEHFSRLYGRRNEVYLPGRTIRIEFFHRGVSDLTDSLRKEANREVLETMFARVVSRIFCIANGINDISLGEGMQRKYPFEGCVYCHSNPCQCQEKRLNADMSWGRNTSPKQWDLRDWQNHLGSLYGEKNRQKGMDYVLNRLSSEVGELISLEHEIPSMTVDEVELEYQLELADSLAWTMAAANILGIDLQESVIKRYGKACQVCNMNPCSCGAHSFRQVRVT